MYTLGFPKSSFTKLDKQDLVLFDNVRPDVQVCKMDVIKSFKLSPKATLAKQRIATTILFRKTPGVIRIVDEWCNLTRNFFLISDIASKVPNHPRFFCHTHDQAIWSLLTKKYGYKSEASRDPMVEYTHLSNTRQNITDRWKMICRTVNPVINGIEYKITQDSFPAIANRDLFRLDSPVKRKKSLRPIVK